MFWWERSCGINELVNGVRVLREEREGNLIEARTKSFGGCTCTVEQDVGEWGRGKSQGEIANARTVFRRSTRSASKEKVSK